MDFTTDCHLAITKANIELTDSSRGSYPTKKMPRGRTKFEDDAVVFHEDKQIPQAYHERPLYVITVIYDIELR